VKTIKADLCIIGAGSGGLSLAAGAVQLGRSVVLCEKGEMGGDCLNYGCVPSKALIAAAAHAQAIRKSPGFGVSAGAPQIDYAAVMDHVRAVIAAIAPHDSQERFERLGCTVIRAAAVFTGPKQVRAGDVLIEARRFVIAAGSSPAIPDIPGLGQTPYLTNETIFANRTRPDHLLVIGAGAVGLELAQAHRRLGCRVTIVEAATMLRNEDQEAVAVLRAALEREGVVIRENAAVRGVRASGAGVELAVGDERIAGSHLLVAAGRKPNIDGLDLAKAGVAAGPRGVAADSRLRTANPRIFAIGDAAGGAFTHIAGDHAATLIRSILFKAPAARRDALGPRVVYCDPEIASVGAACGEAGLKAVKWPFSKSDRAAAERDEEGFVKLIADRGGRIRGASIVGRHAGDLIAMASLAVANRLKIGAFTKFIAAYPTRAEALKRAAGLWYAPTLFSDRTKRLIGLLSALD
jgi:pyruvate/2-oxoglutarate dehydrogenase complex dihydrolipoamide dehydrogenase (E3) component